MNHRSRTSSSCGLLLALSYFTVSACSDEDKSSPKHADASAGGTSSGGSAAGGTTSGGSGGTAGSGGTSTSNGTGGGTGGSAAGAGGSGPSTTAGGTNGGGAGGTGGGGTTAVAGAAGMAGASSVGGLSVDAFCELLQERARSWLRECRSFGDSTGWWGTQRIDRFCSSGRAAIEAGRLEYDPVQAQACADLSVGDCNDIEAFAYSVDSIPQAGWLQSDVCEGVVTGAVELGGECHAFSTDYARECVSGYCTSACPGVCSEFLELGDGCDPIASGCDPETSFCSGSELECQAYVAPGTECGTAQCQPGSFCRYDETEETYSCVVRVGASGACEADLEQCESGLVCYEGTCVDQVPLGGVCNTTAQCPSGSYCNGTCHSYVAVDGDCSAGDLCASGSVCEDGNCILMGDEDDPCPCGAGLYCGPGDLCIPAAGVGEACGEVIMNEPSVPCSSGTSCVPSALEGGAPSAFHCQAVNGLGDACMPQNTSQCPWPLFCHPQNFACVERASEGGACTLTLPRDSCQDGLICRCVDGCEGELYEASAECAPLLGDGVECVTYTECQSGVCDGTCQEPTLCY